MDTLIPLEDIKLLVKIFDNIVTNPNEQKYQNIRKRSLQAKLNNYDGCLIVLYDKGFHSSFDKKRLIFDFNQTNINVIKWFNMVWSAKLKSANVTISTKFNEFFRQFEPADQQDKTDEGHLLESDRTNGKWNGFEKCVLDNCSCLHHTANVLKKYKSFIQAMKNEQNECIMREENNYHSVNLLDDFNHLLLAHSHQFEDIYSILNKQIYDGNGCKLSDCLLIKRHQRDRNKQMRLNDLYFNNDDIIDQQLLDRIHCHYFHSFDIGYKMTRKQKENIIEQERKSNDKCHQIISSKILSKRKQIQKIEGIDRLNTKQNKFQNMCQYQYGNRFYYWKWCQNDQDIFDPAQNNSYNFANDCINSYQSVGYWYVEAKHTNIKSEILCNSICRITQIQWQCVLGKAAKHYQTKMAKSIYCSRRESAKYYGMKYGDILSPNHLIAMLLYCNYDVLSFKFSETYRKINEKDSEHDIKTRHGNYYWLGRYLRECVECFGMKVNDESSYLTMYHGTNKSFTFPSMMAYIKVPLSMTTSYSVGVSFCDNQGMVLELSIYSTDWKLHKESSETRMRLMLCDMCWISDYPNEEEVFCIGGLCPLSFRNIIEPTGVNYSQYLIALAQIMHLFESGRQFQYLCNVVPETPAEFEMMRRSFPSTMQEQQLFFRLISHQLWKSYPNHPHAYQFKSCPAYFDAIMDLQFGNVTMITYRQGSNMILDVFLCDDGWVNLGVLTNLLPNLKFIEYPAGDKDIAFWKNPAIYESILLFIQSVTETKLRLIFVLINPKHYYALQQYLIQYKQRFAEYGWVIGIKKDIHGTDKKQEQQYQSVKYMEKIYGIGLNEYGIEIKTSIYITRIGTLAPLVGMFK